MLMWRQLKSVLSMIPPGAQHECHHRLSHPEAGGLVIDTLRMSCDHCQVCGQTQRLTFQALPGVAFQCECAALSSYPTLTWRLDELDRLGTAGSSPTGSNTGNIFLCDLFYSILTPHH